MPSGTGAFALLITEGTFADSELVEVTRTGTTCTLSGMTFAKAHNAGAVTKYLLSNLDFANFGKLDATNTWALAQTFSAQSTFSAGILNSLGTAALPSYSFTSGRTGDGMYSAAAGSVGISASGAQRARVTAAGLAVTGSISASGPFISNLVGSTATLNLSLSATPNVIEITVANPVFNLPAISWGQLTTPVYFIRDSSRILATLTLNAADDGLGAFNSINEADLVKGAWNDSSIPATGPGGAGAVATGAGCDWMLTKALTNPGIAGAYGGWIFTKHSAGAY